MECVNKCIAGRTRHEFNQTYYQEHKQSKPTNNTDKILEGIFNDLHSNDTPYNDPFTRRQNENSYRRFIDEEEPERPSTSSFRSSLPSDSFRTVSSSTRVPTDSLRTITSGRSQISSEPEPPMYPPSRLPSTTSSLKPPPTETFQKEPTITRPPAYTAPGRIQRGINLEPNEPIRARVIDSSEIGRPGIVRGDILERVGPSETLRPPPTETYPKPPTDTMLKPKDYEDIYKTEIIEQKVVYQSPEKKDLDLTHRNE
jgi:hypothetical protein